MADRPRRPTNARDAAEAAFKRATVKPVVAAPAKPRTLPNRREQVTLRIDSYVLEHFQRQGGAWQDRINDALKSFVGAPQGDETIPVEELNASNDD